MFKPQEYSKLNKNQVRYARDIFEKFVSSLQGEVCGSALDIGCGDGAVTATVVQALCPRLRLVGCDVDAAMLRHARANYSHIGIDFRKLDISADVQIVDRFDYVFSFYCYHHLSNLRKGLENAFKLLNEGGIFLLVFVAKSEIFDGIESVAKQKPWAKYTEEVDNLSPPLQHSCDGQQELKKLMNETGFQILKIDMSHKLMDFDSFEDAISMIHMVEKSGKYIPDNLLEEYYKDLDEVIGKYFIKNNKEMNKFTFDFEEIVVVAKK